jgi:hypothetical protein
MKAVTGRLSSDKKVFNVESSFPLKSLDNKFYMEVKQGLLIFLRFFAIV